MSTDNDEKNSYKKMMMVALGVCVMAVVTASGWLIMTMMPDDDGYVRVSGIVVNSVESTAFYSLGLSTQIHGVRNGDVQALQTLVESECSDGAVCYNLEHIIAQLAYDVGDDKITQMAQQLQPKEQQNLLAWLLVGLEYGYDHPTENAQFLQPSARLKTHFPKLSAFLSIEN